MRLGNLSCLVEGPPGDETPGSRDYSEPPRIRSILLDGDRSRLAEKILQRLTRSFCPDVYGRQESLEVERINS
jgi:hypothetical protein